nr:unnamed protein product [Callosobruchus analis]
MSASPWSAGAASAVPAKPGEEQQLRPPEANGGGPVHHPVVPPPPLPTLPIQRLSSQGDPQDDPRYFPLPKERKRNSFDSSDDGFSSDDDFFGHKKHKHHKDQQQTQAQTGEQKDKDKEKEKDKDKDKVKHRQKGEKHQSEKKKAKQEKAAKGEKERKKKDGTGKDGKKSLEDIPRRESTKRAAKGHKNLSEIGKDDEPEEPAEFQDSDSDPAWTPAANNDEEDLILPIKKNRRVGGKSKKGLKNLISTAAQGAGITEGDEYSGSEPPPKKKSSSSSTHKNKQNIPPTLEDNIAASLQNSIPSISDDGPFKSNKLKEKQHQPGEFVVIKADLKEEWPAIWRVDGKTLLQNAS